MTTRRRNPTESPAFIITIGMIILAILATIMWAVARQPVAYVYSLIRSIQLPYFWKKLPMGDHFLRENILNGAVPNFYDIYIHSFTFGLITSLFIAIVGLRAMAKVDSYSPLKYLRAPNGISYEQAMDYYAGIVPWAQFYKDYPVLEYPTLKGIARQPMTAIEVIISARAVIDVENIGKNAKEAPCLVLDRGRLEDWYKARLWFENPFMNKNEHILDKKEVIEEIVDGLPWEAVLIIYPCLRKVWAFYVYDSSDAFAATGDEVEAFIGDIWKEINTIKRRYKDSVILGYADGEGETTDRDLRHALFADSMEAKASAKPTKEKKKKGEQDANSPLPTNQLHTLSEILTHEGQDFAVTKKAREGIKKLLCAHLIDQTNQHPVGFDNKRNDFIYSDKSNSLKASEQAYRNKAMKNFEMAARAFEGVLFRNHYLTGVIGRSLEATRETGIRPPSEFNWLRFHNKELWYFIHNLGMPSAIPENGAMFEHYHVEKSIGVAIDDGLFMQNTPAALASEAEKYLVESNIKLLMKCREQFPVPVAEMKPEYSNDATKKAKAAIADADKANSSMKPRPVQPEETLEKNLNSPASPVDFISDKTGHDVEDPWK